MTEFFENNFADFFDVVRVKKIKIWSSRWWRFQLATSPIGTKVEYFSLQQSRFNLIP